MDNKLEKGIRHVIQTIFSQIIDVNNHVKTQQENKELSEGDKAATANFAHYHLTVLSILLHEFEDYALEKFPDAKDIINWSRNHYNVGLTNKSFNLCKCQECKIEHEEQEKIAENDKKILEN